MKTKNTAKYTDWLMGLFCVLALIAGIVMHLYGSTRYKGFLIGECRQIKSTFDVSWGDRKIETTLPGSIENPDRNTIVIQTTLKKEKLGEGDSILFRSRQSGVKVYLDNELLYDSGEPFNYPFLMGYGSFWKSIKLGENYDGKQLAIELEPEYTAQAVSGYLPEIYFGTQEAFLVMILKDAAWYLGLILLLTVSGICLFIYGVVLSRKNEMHPLIVLGLFSVDMGLWMLGETHILELFVSNILVVLYLGNITYGLMPVLLVRFLLSYDEFKEKKYLQFLYLIGVVWNIVQLLLVMTGVCSAFESQGMNRIYLGLTVVGLLLALASARKAEKGKRKLYSGLWILVISTVCELAYFFLVSRKNSGRVLIVGICIFIVKSGIDLIREVDRMKKEDIERDVLLKLAYTDSLTQLENRHSFEQEKTRLEGTENTHVTILVADMNGLKQVNNSYGHAYGDQIICRTAEILSESFRDIGKCFRIEGDEFCIIAENKDRTVFETGVRAMEEKVSDLQANIEDYGIAYGVAEGSSKEIEDVFHIADNLMYSRKKDVKTENELVTE